MTQSQDHFVEFDHQEQRIAELELKMIQAHTVFKAILDYVEADISATWISSAKDLAEALREALKE